MRFIRLEPRGQASKTMVYATPLLAVALTLLSGFILFMAMGFDPLKALYAFFVAPLTSVRGVGELVVKATPLVLCAVGLAIGFRANVWNIGAEGQLTLGAIAGGGLALAFYGEGGWWLLPLIAVGGGSMLVPDAVAGFSEVVRVENHAVANAVGGRAIVLGHGLNTRLNPLDEGHRPSGLSDEQWASTVAARRRDLIGALAETVLARGLSPLEHTAIDIALTQTMRENDVPILPMIVDRILAPSADADGRLAEDGRLVGHALRRLVAGDLAGLFDGPSTVAFDPSLPMISLDLSRVTENSTLISVLMTCSSAWMESALLDPNGGQRWVIYDEAWRLMSHPALLRRMDAHWRLARHYGIANMLIFHKLTDLDNVGDQGSAMRSLANSLLANAETRIVYRQESDQLGPTASALGLTGTEQQLLPNLGVGQGLWRIKARSFVTQHQLHPAELALFDTSSRAAGGHR